MPTPTKGPRLGGSPAHERLMLANLATSLFRHGRITTTVAKAKRLRPFAEQLITKAKRGDLHSRRQVMEVVRDRTVSAVLFDEIGPRYAHRPGGYTRIVRTGLRRGDAAPMAIIELVEPMAEPPAPKEQKEQRRSRRREARQEAVAVLAGEAGTEAEATAAGDAAPAEGDGDRPAEAEGDQPADKA